MRRFFLIFPILNHSSNQVTKFIMSKKLLRSSNLLKEELEEAQERLLSYVRRVGRDVQVEKQLKTNNQTPNERNRFAVETKLCFSCLQGTHSFRQCPTKYSCPKQGCKSSHSVLLQGAERVFSKSTSSGSQLQNT